MAPIKALCSERYDDWKRKFEKYGVTCRELTGDSEMDDFYALKDATLILTTPVSDVTYKYIKVYILYLLTADTDSVCSACYGFKYYCYTAAMVIVLLREKITQKLEVMNLRVFPHANSASPFTRILTPSSQFTSEQDE